MLEELYLYELAISYKRIRHYYSRTSVLFRKKEIYKMAQKRIEVNIITSNLRSHTHTYITEYFCNIIIIKSLLMHRLI